MAEFYGFDVVFFVKFFIVFIIFVILPVWIFNFVEISLLWKLGFTLGGGVGALIALMGKSAKYH